jgi:hypothetical protein
MYQSVSVQLDQGDEANVEPGKEVREDHFLTPILFKLYNEYYKKRST